MARFLGTALILSMAYPIAAASPGNLPTLTPHEIAEGWLLLFDGETTFGWATQGPVAVKGGLLVVGGDRLASAQPTTIFGRHELCYDWSHDARTWFSKEKPLPFFEKIAGRISCKVPKGKTVFLRNLKLRPLGLEPIFYGKDLSGWKEFPDRKSQFKVTPEGWLNIKNGPGDLQTEKQWANFILQLECRTNGPNLNSGVFFRCRPNEYQQGYEAQIHNAFDLKAPRDYLVDEYDPVTHSLKGKKRVQSLARDYGTGAIYRRVPARKQVSFDGEWFTMTVAAQGNRIATWVNGIQQVDWTDHRPLNDNARNGCRLEKGPVSLQGHDPTTDINFRNLRIAVLPGR
jgi:hypothetical protein